jgi:kynurenine formamidase
LRHFAYQKEQRFYNNTTLDELLNPEKNRLGLNHWHTAGGVAGRGVLIDYAEYTAQKGLVLDATKDLRISFDEMQACLRWQSANSTSLLEFKHGDILFIRTGFMRDYAHLNEAREREIGLETPPCTPGMIQDPRLLEWLWEHRIAAVAGDSPSWECFPPDKAAGFLYHEVLIAGWGCPIAEYIWLEDLARKCLESRRWTFFVASSPLNVNGGVGSPANMMAIM